MVVALILALSPFQAALRSLIFPGWGQISVGVSPRAFVITEGVLGVGTFLAWQESRRAATNAEIYALRHARPDGNLTPRFFDLAEGYETFEDYRDDLYRQARDLYPGDLDAQNRYVQERLPGVTWAWESREAWFAYADLRGMARSWGNRTRVLVGLLVVHHVVSALDAYFRARDAGLHLTVHPGPYGGAGVSVTARF